MLANQKNLDPEERQRLKNRRNKTLDNMAYADMVRMQEEQFEENEYTKLLIELNKTDNLNITDFEDIQKGNTRLNLSGLQQGNTSEVDNSTIPARPQTAKERYILEMKKKGVEVNTTEIKEDMLKRMH